MLGMRNQAVTEGSGLLNLEADQQYTTWFVHHIPEFIQLRELDLLIMVMVGCHHPSSRFAVEHDRQFGPNKLTLKRRSSMLDDDLGSVGPIRRIRQKPSLLSHRSPLSLGSHAAQISLKKKLPLEDEPRHKISKTFGENGDNSTPSTSYTPVPSKSSKVAARIFQQLENMTSKDKSSESKPAAAREKLPLKLKPIMPQDGHKLEGWSKATLPYARDSSQEQGKLEENGPKESVGPSEMLTPTVNIGASSGKASRPMVETTDSALKTFESQHPQKRRASEMSAHEDYLEQDDKRHSNGPAPQPLGDRRGTTQIALNDGMPSPAELKLGKNTIQLATKVTSGSFI
ncbi:Nuclear pore complex protein [Abeliophyllum distichum]|uniref:Nuclear pore complex protein n=1 Tax=Abeliophyllum distichum TaxID=126358 RepID=A0ABD1VRH7_9LAMI